VYIIKIEGFIGTKCACRCVSDWSSVCGGGLIGCDNI